MNGKTVQSGRKEGGAYIRLPVPLGTPEAFRHGATADILHLLIDNPDRDFTNRELHRITEHGLGGVNAAVNVLDALGVVDVDRSGRANAVRINPDMLVKPDDPLTMIPQSEYQAPVREILSQLEERLGENVAVVLFGSVARGTADRTSDIDLFVVVEDNRMEAQREAHGVEQEIGDDQFDGDRYEPHIIVETAASAATHDRIEEILAEGLTLRATPALTEVKEEVFDNGAR